VPPAHTTVYTPSGVVHRASSSSSSRARSRARATALEVAADLDEGRARGRRALAGRTPEVQACADVAAGGLDKLTVAVQIEPSGRVSARLVGEPEAPLSRCIDAALRHTPVAAPSASISFTHTFTLRPTPPRP